MPHNAVAHDTEVADVRKVHSGLAVAVIYLYSSESDFANLVNQHMSTGLPIVPSGPVGLLANASNIRLFKANESSNGESPSVLYVWS